MKGYSSLIAPLLADGRQVLLYQGHMDLRDGVAATEAWLHGAFNQSSPVIASGLINAERHVWRDDDYSDDDNSNTTDTVAGYIKTHGNLTHVVVVGAGHMVPMDQPRRAHAMLQGLVAGELAGVPLVSV
jgi:vitellogenic carboxypeptidase-like protein